MEVTFDETLSFASHITRKAHKTLGSVSTLSDFSHNVYRRLYTALVSPHYQIYIDEIESVQIKYLQTKRRSC